MIHNIPSTLFLNSIVDFYAKSGFISIPCICLFLAPAVNVSVGSRHWNALLTLANETKCNCEISQPKQHPNFGCSIQRGQASLFYYLLLTSVDHNYLTLNKKTDSVVFRLTLAVIRLGLFVYFKCDRILNPLALIFLFSR